MYQVWTVEQEQVLRDYGSLGAERCREIIGEECGIWRSVDATQRHAYRIGADITSWEVCPHCGRRVKRLSDRDGLCPICVQREAAEQHRRYYQWLLDEESRREFEEAKREHERVRKQSSGYAKKHGLPSKREWNAAHRDLSK